jgi:hypothetical protein
VDSEKIKQQGEMQLQQNDLQLEKYKIDQQEQTKRLKMQQDHEYQMAQLNLEMEKLRQGQQKLVLDSNRAQAQENRADEQLDHQQGMDLDNADRADRQLEHDAAAAKAKTVDKKD